MRARELICILLLSEVILAQGMNQEFIIKEFPKTITTSSADTIILDLSRYLRLERFKKIELNNCSGVKYHSPVFRGAAMISPYGDEKHGDCRAVESSGVLDKVFLLCGESRITLAQLSRVNNPDVSVELNLASTITLNNGKISKCNAIERAPGGDLLFVGCSTDTDSLVFVAIKMEVEKDTQGEEKYTLKQVDFYEREKAIADIGKNFEIDVLDGDLGNSIYARNPNIEEGFKSILISYSTNDQKFHPEIQKLIVTKDIKNWPTEEIMYVDGHSGILAVGTRDSVGIPSIRVCILGSLSNQFCGLPTKITDKAIEENNFIFSIRASQSDNYLEVSIFSKSILAFIAFSIGENFNLKPTTKIPSFERKFESALNIESPDRTYRYRDRLYLFGRKSDGLPQATIVWIDRGNWMDLNLQTPNSGIPYMQEDPFDSDQDDFYYFTKEGVVLSHFKVPNLTFGPPLNVEGDPSSFRQRCEFSITFEGIETPVTIALNRDTLFKPMSSVMVSYDKSYVLSPTSYLITPLTVNSGNALRYTVSIDSEDQQKSFSASVLHATMLKGKIPKLGVSQPIVASSFDFRWVAGDFYFVHRESKGMIYRINTELMSEDILVDLYASFDTKDISSSIELLDGAISSDRLFIFLDTRTKEQKPGDDGFANLLFSISLTDPNDQWITKSNTHLDAASVEYSKNFLYIHGIIVSETPLDPYYAKIKANERYDELIVFMPISPTGKKICPKEIQSFELYAKASLVIISYCGGQSAHTMYLMNFERRFPSELTLISSNNLDSFNKPKLCLTDAHIHIIDTSANGFLVMKTFDADVDEGSIYTYPVTDLGVSNVYDIACDAHKDMYYLLASKDDGTKDAKKLIIALRGEAQNNPLRRIHSVTEVDWEVDSISAGSNSFIDQSILVFGKSKNLDSFTFMKMLPQIPLVIFKFNKDYEHPELLNSMTINAFVIVEQFGVGRIEDQSKSVSISLENKMASGKITAIRNLDLTEIKDIKKEIEIENYINMEGPIESIELKSRFPSDNNKIIQRLSKGGSRKLPESMKELVEFDTVDGSYVLAWTTNNLNFYLSGTPLIEDIEINGKVIAAKVLATSYYKEHIALVWIERVGEQLLYLIHPKKGGSPTIWETEISINKLEEFCENVHFFDIPHNNREFYAIICTNNFLDPQIVYTMFEHKSSGKLQFQAEPSRQDTGGKVISMGASKYEMQINLMILLGNSSTISNTVAYPEFGQGDDFKLIPRAIDSIQEISILSFLTQNTKIHCSSSKKIHTLMYNMIPFVCAIFGPAERSSIVTVELNSYKYFSENNLVYGISLSRYKLVGYENIFGYAPTFGYFDDSHMVITYSKLSLFKGPVVNLEASENINSDVIIAIFKRMKDSQHQNPVSLYGIIPGSTIGVTKIEDLTVRLIGSPDPESNNLLIHIKGSAELVEWRVQKATLQLKDYSKVSSIFDFIHLRDLAPEGFKYKTSNFVFSNSLPELDDAAEAENKRVANELERIRQDAIFAQNEKKRTEENESAIKELKNLKEQLIKLKSELEEIKKKDGGDDNGANKKDGSNNTILYILIAIILVMLIIIGIASYYFIMGNKESPRANYNDEVSLDE